MHETQKKDDIASSQIAMRVSVVSIIVNLALSLLKLLAGILAKSGAMISDAVHSASDVFSTFVVIAGVQMAKKQPDKEHPYGHERMECVASVLLAVVLAATGAGIGYKGVEKIASPEVGELAVPGTLALAAAVISVIVKEGMYQYTRRAAKQIARMRCRPWVPLRVSSAQGWGCRCLIRWQASSSACSSKRRRLIFSGMLWTKWSINPARMRPSARCGRSSSKQRAFSALTS